MAETYLKFEPPTNVAVYIKLRFDSPIEQDRSAHPDWKPSYIWGVSEWDGTNWTDKSWRIGEQVVELFKSIQAKKGSQFKVIRREGKAKTSGRTFHYYEVFDKEKLYDSRDYAMGISEELPSEPSEAPPEGSKLPDVSPTPPQVLPPPNQPAKPKRTYGEIMLETWSIALGCLPVEWVNKLSEKERLEVYLRLYDSSTTMFNTQWMEENKH